MPEKIDWWEQVLRWLQSYLPVLGGFSIATTIAYIRERREGAHWKQSLGEAITCGLLSVGAIRLLDWWLSQHGNTEAWEMLAEFCGASIGFLGTKKVYALFEAVIQIVKNRLGAKND